MTKEAAYALAAFIDDCDPRCEAAAFSLISGEGAVVVWQRGQGRAGPLELYHSIKAYATDAAREAGDPAFGERLHEWLEALGITVTGD